ncbi:MAG: PSD1 and planctomycete cytochrome C domain-containing protein [Planctomyces sp.]
MHRKPIAPMAMNSRHPLFSSGVIALPILLTLLSTGSVFPEWITQGALASVIAEEVTPQPDSGSAVNGDRQFYREQIEPILKKHCFECHSATSSPIQGSLRLDSLPGLLRGGDSGPAIVPGDAEVSVLIAAIRHQNGIAMPPDEEPLSDEIIEKFVRWIQNGAIGPSEEETPASETIDAKAHWAFQPLTVPPVPMVSAGAEAASGEELNPIDAFIAERLQQKGWAFSKSLDKAAWIRRVTLDLTGLPATPEETEAFVQDQSPDAAVKVVDHLLNSQHFGERQAQHWLDVIRFAETEGYEYDTHLPGAWRFRDYVIDSMNSDKPYDQFIREQIAGDELDPENSEYQTASVFHRLGPVRRNAGNPELALSRNEVLTERTDVIGSAILGLSVGCARCHNHKLEPISQKDYYRLQAFLSATEENNLAMVSDEQRSLIDFEKQKAREQQTLLRKQMATAAPEERVELEKAVKELDQQLPATMPMVPATRNDFAKRTSIHVLKRGVWGQNGEPVGPRPLSILTADTVKELSQETPQPRTQLADWLVSPQNPLTARVIVNRIWQQHFGNGIVRTANDFGTHGERPSHPELLDWLAGELIRGGWRMKSIHRMIVLSATYRQGSQSISREISSRDDPDNRLLWQMPRRRLTAEEIRDSMLSVSGRLNRKAGGPSVMVPVAPELVQLLYKPDQWKTPSDPKENDRRSIYLIAKRNLRLPFMEAFDAPALLQSCARRESSTHAPQALELLNGTLSNDLAKAFADRLTKECGTDAPELIRRGFQLAAGRLPSDHEQTLSEEFLREQPLEEFTLALFNLNDFLYSP